jgi:hypothetical protein
MLILNSEDRFLGTVYASSADLSSVHGEQSTVVINLSGEFLAGLYYQTVHQRTTTSICARAAPPPILMHGTTSSATK